MAPTPSGARVWRWGRWVSQIPTPPPASDLPGLRFFEFNMCGSACNQGSVTGVVEAIRDSVLGFRPEVVLLNEACLAQVDRLWEHLNDRGYPMSACFGATTGVSLCPGAEGERWYGNAVFSRGAGIGAPEMLALPNRAHLAEQRSVISMSADLKGVPALVAATHLAPRSKDETYNRLQITEVARVHNERVAQGHIVVLGGDFNATPGQLGEIYTPAGRFDEVDRPENEATFKRDKIDYIFLAASRFTALTGDATSSSWSDHRPLRGTATLKTG